MSQLIPFLFNTNAVRVHVDNDDTLWWVLTDLCTILDLSNPSEVAKRLEPEELSTLSFSEGGRPSGLLLVNESGLYRLIFRSNKEEARPFQNWVFSEVLPQIRKTGKYAAPMPALPPPRTEEQDLAFIDQSLTLLERLQAVDGRDRLFFADQVRNVTRRALAPPTLPATQSLPAVPQPHGASVSDRLYVVAPRLSEKMHRTASITAGKRCAAEYRTRYGMDPQKFQQFIDGATRPVSWFAPGDWSWVDAICQTVAAGMAPAVQP